MFEHRREELVEGFIALLVFGQQVVERPHEYQAFFRLPGDRDLAENSTKGLDTLATPVYNKDFGSNVRFIGDPL